MSPEFGQQLYSQYHERFTNPMNLEEFNKQKKQQEDRQERQISRKVFDKSLKRRRIFTWVTVVIAFAAGVVIAAEWPERWFAGLGEYSPYIGMAIILILIVSLFKDWIRKDGAFYSLDI